MKEKILRALWLQFSFILIALFFSLGTQASKSKRLPDRVTGEYIVKLKPGLRIQSLRALSQDLFQEKLQLVEKIGHEDAVFLAKSADQEGLDRNSMLSFQSQREVEYIEPNFLYYTMTGGGSPGKAPDESEPEVPDAEEALTPEAFVTNDPSLDKLWGLRNFGQDDPMGRAGTALADMKAAQAWNFAKGSKEIVVAVVDTGIDYNHEDLKANMWSQVVEGKTIHGFNATNDTFDPMDDNNHGTHVAGTIGAVGNNGIGIVGVNWHVSLMAVKFLDADGSGSSANAIKAIDFAVTNGADVINNSWGGGSRSQALFEALKRAEDAGVVVVNAAGNSNENIDTKPGYPARYAIDTMIAVAASGNHDKRTSFSSFGDENVELFAPGLNIYSTLPNNRYGTLSGTSMATPHVAGAVALLLSLDKMTKDKGAARAAALKQRLMDTVSVKGRFRDTAITSGRLNVLKAVEASLKAP